MSIPPSGLIFIPLSLVIFFLAPRWLAQLAIISAVFAAAAVANFGSASFPVGLSPFFFTALLIALRTIPAWLGDGFRPALSEPLRRHLRMIIAFIGWAIFSGLLFPLLFSGLPIDLARAGPDLTYYSLMPLRWSLSNAGQAGYLLLDLIVILYMLRRIRARADLEKMCAAFGWAGVIVILVGAYQWLAHQAGLPFPMQLFNSNTAWAQLANQHMGGIFRISATFDESSGAGSFLAAWVSFEFVLGSNQGRASLRHLVLAMIGVLAVIATTSTTGYAITAIMLLIIVVKSAFAPRLGGRTGTPMLTGFIIIAALAAGIFVLTAQGRTMLAGAMLDKAQSTSSIHRTATIVRSLDVFTGTYGLGAGLGSNRAMSLAAYIISNLGVAGTMLFMWLLASLISMSRAVRGSQSGDDSLPLLHQALAMALLSRLLALSASGAEITDPIMWLLWSLLLAAIRQRSVTATIDLSAAAPVSPAFA